VTDEEILRKVKAALPKDCGFVCEGPGILVLVAGASAAVCLTVSGGKAKISEFCWCIGGTAAGSKMMAALESVGVPVAS